MPGRLRRSPAALWRRTGDGVLARVVDGDFVWLEGGATAVWHALAEPLDADALLDELAASHGVERERIAGDVLPTIEQLVAAGLVEESPS